MASKFFTWTKGDRRHAATELQKAGDLALAPSTSSEFPEVCSDRIQKRKPSPLNQTVAPNNANSIFRNALDPAAVLHDAASSATNLLAAVNDMLKSPVLASFHRRSILDKPLPGRPRSYTAPPTPTIAELPGSILLENQGFPRILELSTSFDDLNMRRARGERAEGLAPDRPFTSPREMPARRPTHKKSLSENASKGNRQARSTMNSPTWSKDSNLSLCSQSTNPMSSSFDSVKAKVDSESTRSLLQPSPLIIERKHTNRSSLQTLLSISDNENEKPMSEQIMDLRGTITAQNHTISTLTSQFASLRSAHEAHVASLVDAHAKELATLKTYTEGLEQRTASFKAIRRAPSSHLMLMLDTADPSTPVPRTQLEATSVTSLQSFQTAIEQPSGPQHHGGAGSGTPKKSQPQHDQPDVAGKHKPKSEAEPTKTLSMNAMEQLNKSKRRERGLRNEINILEARLSESNAEKVDALEAARFLEEKLTESRKRDETMRLEMNELRTRPTHEDVERMAAKLKEAENKVALLELQVRTTTDQTEASVIAAFVRQISDNQTKLKEKEAYVRQLEHENQVSRLDADDAERRLAELAKINDKLINDVAEGNVQEIKKANDELELKAAEQQATIAKLQKQSDDFYRLLKAEIRKKACKRQECMADGHLDLELYPRIAKEENENDVTLIIEKRRSEVQERMSSAENDAAIEAFSDPQQYIQKLQREIDYHIRDVVAFRLDIKGYKKDVNRFERQIKKRDTMISLLQQATSSPKSFVSAKTVASNGSRESCASGTTFSSGLGISPTSNSPYSITTKTTTPEPSSKSYASVMPELGLILKKDVELQSQASTSTLRTNKDLPDPPPRSPPPRPTTPISNGSGAEFVFSTPSKRRGIFPATPSSSLGALRSTTSLASTASTVADPLTPEATPGSKDKPKLRSQRSVSESIISSYAHNRWTPDVTPERRPFSRASSRASSRTGNVVGTTPDGSPARPTGGIFGSPMASSGTVIHRPGTAMGMRMRANTAASLYSSSDKSSFRANVLADAESHQHKRSQSDSRTVLPGLPGKKVSPRANSFSPAPTTGTTRLQFIPNGKGDLPETRRAMSPASHVTSISPIPNITINGTNTVPVNGSVVMPSASVPSSSDAATKKTPLGRFRRTPGEGPKSPPPISNVKAIQAIREAQGKTTNYVRLAQQRMDESKGKFRKEDIGKNMI